MAIPLQSSASASRSQFASEGRNERVQLPVDQAQGSMCRFELWSRRFLPVWRVLSRRGWLHEAHREPRPSCKCLGRFVLAPRSESEGLERLHTYDIRGDTHVYEAATILDGGLTRQPKQVWILLVYEGETVAQLFQTMNARVSQYIVRS